jgi:hypothetical protein
MGNRSLGGIQTAVQQTTGVGVIPTREKLLSRVEGAFNLTRPVLKKAEQKTLGEDKTMSPVNALNSKARSNSN